MRLRLTSFNPIEAVLIRSGRFPVPVVDGFWGMMSARALIAAVELGVFEALADGPKTSAQVAEATGTDPIGCEALLNALNGFRYVRRRDGVYRNSRSAKRWLTSSSNVAQREAFGLFDVLWDEMGDMEAQLRSSEARDFHRADRDERFWQRYESGLAQFSKLTAGEIVRRVRLDGEPRRLLDVGGGHASYASAFCGRYPTLSAEVLDLPGATAVGRELVAAAGLGERVAFREGDLLVEEWGEGHDVVLLFNVVHVLPPERVPEVFAKARAALRDSGTFVVVDSVHKGGARDIDTAGGANELLFYVINGTRAYPEDAVAGWMRGAGFSDVKVRHLLTLPQAALTTGRA